MSRLDDLKVLYTHEPKDKKMQVFDSILPPCRILDLLSIQDIMELNRIAKSKKLSSKPAEKLNMIKNIMGARGFKRMASGTNRIVFKYMENQSFVIKVAYDNVGLGDNLCELYNQEYIKPFCCKVFEVSPCGTVGMFERVRPIKNREEFASIAGDIYDIMIGKFIGKYILADFGTKYFANWGLRGDMHPVILDFPYIYELDGAKIFCNRPDPTSPYGFCGGEIDYDEGFNHLVCTKCGKTFMASELKLAAEKKSKDIIIETEDIDMIVQIYKGEDLIASNDSTKESKTYRRDSRGRKKETPLEYRQRKKYEGFSVEIVTSEESSEKEDATVTENIETVNKNITENDFNQNYSLADIPEVDTMYRDMSIDIVGRKGKPVVGKDGENVIVEEQKQQPQSSFYGCDIAQEIAEKNRELQEEKPIVEYSAPIEYPANIHTDEDIETVEEPEVIETDDADSEIGSDAGDMNDLARRMMTGQFNDHNEEDSNSEPEDQDVRAEDLVEIVPRSDVEVEDNTIDNKEETVSPEFL